MEKYDPDLIKSLVGPSSKDLFPPNDKNNFDIYSFVTEKTGIEERKKLNSFEINSIKGIHNLLGKKENSIVNFTNENKDLTNIISLQYNSKKLSFYNPPNQLPGLYIEPKAQITAETIAEFAFPIAQFIDQLKPDYIIACDRGARIFALAVSKMYRELYGALPTRDHAIRFRKISSNIAPQMVEEGLKKDVEEMLRTTPSPTVLVLDDWINFGGTQRVIIKTFERLSGGKANVVYGVMRGPGAQITGDTNSAALGDWHDKPEIIGVDYNPGLRPQVVGSRLSKLYREEMYRNIEKFVRELKLVGTRKK